MAQFTGNGSEHTPERPDYKARIDEARRAQAAVYLATDESVAQDISRIIKGLADAVEALLAIEQRLTNHIVQLAAERDALPAENEKLRAQRDEWCARARRRHITINELTGRLDAMTVEWEYGLVNPDARRGQYGRDDTAHLVSTNREHIERQHKRGHPAIQFVRRIKAGPWTVVPEGEQP